MHTSITKNIVYFEFIVEKITGSVFNDNMALNIFKES